MLDLAGPITVAFDQSTKRDQFYVTEPSKTIVMSPNSVQQPLEKIIATITGKKSELVKGKQIDLSLVRKCTRRPSSHHDETMPTTITNHPTIDLKANGDSIKDIYVTTTEALATNQTQTTGENGINQPRNQTAIAKQPLVSVLSRRTKPSMKKERPRNVTTLTSGEFAQLLKTCNVTVKSVRSGDPSDKCEPKKVPRDGAVVLRPSWTRGKAIAPPLKWHHTNFEPNKQLKVAKTRKNCKAVSVTVAKPPQRQRRKSPSPQSDHARSLASHALPLNQAWSDLASRDQASEDTIKETSDPLEPLLLPQNSDPFLSDCDVRECLKGADALTSQASDVIGGSSESRTETGGDLAPGEEWKSFVRMDDNKDCGKTVEEQTPSSDAAECDTLFSDMTQYVDSQQPQLASNKLAPIFDFGTTNIFEDIFNCDTSKLLNDDDFNNVLMNTNFSFLTNDADLSDVTNIPPCGSGPVSNYDFYNENTSLPCQNPPPLAVPQSRLHHDVMTSPRTSCDHQMSHSFSDTDSGIHSPGSTPVKTSPPPHVTFDDVTDANRDWRGFNGCHSNLTSPCVGSPSLDQEFFNASASPSNFYVTKATPQEVFPTQTSPSPEAEPHLLNMDEPTSFYKTKPYESFTTNEPTLLPLDPLPPVKSENDYFVTPNSIDLSPPGSPFPIPANDDKTKPKYRHSVGNWQIAVSLQPDKEVKIEPASDDRRHFGACLAAKTVDANSFRRRKPKPKEPTRKRKVLTLTEGQLCCKVRKISSTEKGKTVHLWEFIRDILLNPEHCPTLIKWEDRQQGVFRFMQSDVVASMWGEKKRNPKMTYEKLSRAMRYYYNRGILERVDGRRLVYKFGPNAHGWKLPDVVTSQEGSVKTTTVVEHLCESTGLTIQTSEVSKKVSTTTLPASATPKSESNSAHSRRLKTPPRDGKVVGPIVRATKVTAKPAMLGLTTLTAKTPVTSGVVTSPTATERFPALPSANVLLGKQIRLAVTH